MYYLTKIHHKRMVSVPGPCAQLSILQLTFKSLQARASVPSVLFEC